MLKIIGRALVVTLLACVVLPVAAQTQQTSGVLSNNSGNTSRTFFISGEPTLILNGFDLNARSLQLPASITSVSLDVDTPVQGATSEIVIYQDANGGAPSDAVLVARQQVIINTSGVFTYSFPTAVSVNQAFIWIGFYLPVDFRFRADRSGTSVLTYWGWTPGTTFDLATLTNATVFGPGDGTAPVNINMGGIARITAGVTGTLLPGTQQGALLPPVSGGSTSEAARSADGRLIQTPGDVAQARLNVLRQYPGCSLLSYDTEDVGVTLGGGVGMECSQIWPGYTPGNPVGYTQRGPLYNIVIYNDQGQSIAGEIPAAVTHCLRPPTDYINVAMVGLAFGVPERWYILPTQRYGDYICAEVNRGGLISYFTPN